MTPDVVLMRGAGPGPGAHCYCANPPATLLPAPHRDITKLTRGEFCIWPLILFIAKHLAVLLLFITEQLIPLEIYLKSTIKMFRKIILKHKWRKEHITRTRKKPIIEPGSILHEHDNVHLSSKRVCKMFHTHLHELPQIGWFIRINLLCSS